MDLAEGVLRGEVRALARAIRLLEEGDVAGAELLHRLRGKGAGAQIVGITGPPGSGKSTLADQLITAWRAQGHRVGVLAVDPSSPFSGGAILGDRVRMQRHSSDADVFIRSMASRGHLGGLATAANEAVKLMIAGGRTRCLLETVGVGQSELEVMQAADTTVVVLTPVSGDAVQIIKAGILEIADIFVVNKSDVGGAARVYRDLKDLVRQTKAHAPWPPPVIMTTASTGKGIDELLTAMDEHWRHLQESGELHARRRERVRSEIEAIVVDKATSKARQALESDAFAAELRQDPEAVDPYAIAEAILDGRAQ